jgi:PAS domain S-box-containing protein
MRSLLHTILQSSLGLQVIGVAALMALLGGGVVGLVLTDRARSALRDNILSNSLAATDLATALAASYMGDAQAAARELASRPAVQTAVSNGDFSSLDLDLDRWIIEHPNLDVVISDLNGVTRVTSLSDKSSVGVIRLDEDWFQGPMTTGQPYLGSPGLSEVTRESRIPYGIPLRDDAGVIRGVLTASIQLDALSNVITSIHVGPNARASLTDLERGIILAHVDATRILSPELGKNRAAQYMQAGERGVLEDTTSSGENVLAAFGPVPGLPWGILIQDPSAEAFAPLDEMARDTVQLLAATVVLAVALGTVLALRIGRPLRRLRATAEAMASGDLDRRAGLVRHDEVGELGRAFDHMADRLQTSIGRANESEAGIRAVMDSVADGIMSFDEGGRIHSSNLAAERLFGYTAVELVGQSFECLVPDAATHETETTWFARIWSAKSAISTGHTCQGRRKDGTGLALELATSQTGLNGRRRLIVVARDITERKQAEEALRASEERSRRQYKGFPLPTSSWLKVGDDLVLQDYNDAAEVIAGGDISGWLGARASERFAHAPQILADLYACVAEQRTLEREMHYRLRPTGLERELTLTYVFVPPQTVMLHTEDITEAKRAAQQREAMAQSEKLRALGQMATGIAHDLNQSLMLVASYSDLARQALVEDPPNLAELENLMTTTTQAALDGGETVKRLLLFTRATPEQDSQLVDLSKVVHEAAQLTAPRWRDAAEAEGRRISLEIEAQSHPTVQGSSAQLRELMTNLIFNAVDALPTGGTIRLRVLAEDRQGIVEVTDSGIGMSAEVRERVFEPFFTTKGEGGTGLGLAMVFGIVKRHGGHIEVRSAPGDGTTVRITLPLLNASAAPEPTPTRKTQLEPLMPLRILAVDDEPMMTKAVMRMLKPAGHVVTMAASGEEALEKLAEQVFDVVVSDMGMGAGMNGWELADAVKRRWPSIRFMLATGWGATIDPGEARARGVEAILSKPYHPDDLLQALARVDAVA